MRWCLLWASRFMVMASVLAPAQAADVAISCGAVGVELEICREGAEAWAEATGNTVRVISTPNSSTDRLALYQQLLAARSPDIDVFQIDTIWPGTLHAHFLDLRAHVAEKRLAAQFDAVIANNRVDGRLVALPWFVDVGLLYYRRDLLARHGFEPPATWAALTQQARLIQRRERAAGNRRLWGFVWQGRAYEGLTCNALEWVASHGGGSLIDPDGRISISNPRAVRALELAASWVEQITPLGVLNYDEEQARGVFHSGQAVFMRNWPYAWSLVNAPSSPLRGKVGVAPLPHGPEGPSTGTLGGWQLAISRYSQAPEAAIDLALYLTDRSEQRRRALAGGYHPTWRTLYEDPALREANPLLPVIRRAIEHAVVRPADVTGRRYSQVSHAFWSAVHATLAGRGSAADNLARLEPRLERILRRGR